MVGIWAGGLGDQEARLGISSRSWGKVPAVQVEEPPPAETDKELACRLQAEE